VQRPRRNIELKARDRDPVASLKICRALGAEDCGEIAQRDIYFEVAHGGLKLREEEPGRPHLIQFERANEPQQRESRYRIIELGDGAALRAALAEALGIRGTVVKRRRLLLWRGVRIHLDEVEQLGTFIELEAVAPPDSDLAHERQLVAHLRDALGITDERLVAFGYAEQLIHGSLSEQGNSASHKHDDRRLLFIGDSLVAGVGDPAGMGWVGRAVAASFELGLPLTAYNLGVRGETSEQVAERWRAESLPRLPPATGRKIVLSFGANDTTVESGSLRVAPERSCAVLATMLREATSLGLPVLMVGPAPVDDREQNERIHSLSTAFADVCQRAGAAFVGVVEPLLASRTWMTQVSAGDGAHPGADGYQALADLVIAAGWADWLRG